MTSKELLKEIEAWLSFNTEPSKEEISRLKFMIDNGLGWRDMRRISHNYAQR